MREAALASGQTPKDRRRLRNAMCHSERASDTNARQSSCLLRCSLTKERRSLFARSG